MNKSQMQALKIAQVHLHLGNKESAIRILQSEIRSAPKLKQQQVLQQILNSL